MSAAHLTRRELLEGTGLLIVAFAMGRAPSALAADGGDIAARPTAPEQLDSWLTVGRDGQVVLYTGRVDLGTGTETLFTQFVAEELDVPVGRVKVVMGDTRLTPDQGKTTASMNAVRGSQPVRVAAAEARARLIALASERLGVPASELGTAEGYVVHSSGAGERIAYGDLVGDKRLQATLEPVGKSPDDISRGIMLKPKAPLKDAKDYKVVGTSLPRVDIPAKVTGTFEYVHNVRVPDMLHGRVVRPPAIGAKLLTVAEESIRPVPGARVLRKNDFLAVVAPREEDAVAAARTLQATWSDAETLPPFDGFHDALRRAKVVSEASTYNVGDVAAGMAKGKTRLKATYDFPFQDHGMIGPSCAVADVKADHALIWSGSQWPQGDRADIAKMLGLPLEQVQIVWREAAGSYGRLGCDDAAADAALMSQMAGRPVRVQWSRADEHGWEPLSPAMTMTIEGAIDEAGRVTAFDYVQHSPSHSNGERGNYIAWRLIGGNPAYGRMSGGAANLWYDIPAKRGHNVFVEPWLRSIYLRSPGGIQSIFAYESFMEEMAALAGLDPLAFRLKNTQDARDQAVLQEATKLAGWQARTTPRKRDAAAAILTGRGLAMARYGIGDSRSAVVTDVEIERSSGKVRLVQACIAFDCGPVLNPDGLLNQIEGGLLQGLSRGLHEEVRFDRRKVTSLDWKDYRILGFAELPEVKTKLIPRPDQLWGSAGEAGTVASAASLANAVFDATGKHPRRLPLAPDYVKTLL